MAEHIRIHATMEQAMGATICGSLKTLKPGTVDNLQSMPAPGSELADGAGRRQFVRPKGKASARRPPRYVPRGSPSLAGYTHPAWHMQQSHR